MALPEFNNKGLLPDGVHPTSIAELQERCVVPFEKSKRRKLVFEGFQRYQREIQKHGIHATQWIDGSFTDATRLDPDDIDAANFCSASNLNSINREAQKSVKALLSGGPATKTDFYTHSFLVVQFPAGHPFAAAFEKQRKYWRDWFSRPQDYTGPAKVAAPSRGRKGIVQMNVGNVNLCPIVSDE